MTRANKLLSVIGEADDSNSLFAADDSVVDDETSIKDDESDEPLDLGAEDDTLATDDDEFGLGGSASTPSVRIEKDGNKTNEEIRKEAPKKFRRINQPGDYFVVTKAGYLESRDREGIVFSARPIR